MTGAQYLFSGRGELVTAVVDRSMQKVHHDLPIVLFLGQPGSGRSTLLDAISDRYAERAPTVMVDYLADLSPSTRIREVLADLMVQFDARVRGLRLTFPRVLIGLAAVDVPLGRHSAVRRRQILRDALLDRKGTHERLEEVITHTVATLRATQSGTSQAAAEVETSQAVAAVEGLIKVLDIGSVTSRVAFRWSPAARWYLTAVDGRKEDPLDALTLLNRWERGLGPGHPDEVRQPEAVDDVLLRAFLADLAAAYTGGPRANSRPLNCLFSLHRADTGAARTFVHALIDARNSAPRTALPDPLLVVGTARIRFSEPDRPEHCSISASSTEDASYDDWKDVRDGLTLTAGAGRPWLYTVPLPPLDTDRDYPGLVPGLVGHGHGLDRNAVDLARRFTQGHPRTAKAVLEWTADSTGRSRAPLRASFSELTSTAHSPVIEDLISRELELDENSPLRVQLVTISAAHRVEELDCLRALGAREIPTELATFLREDLWVVAGPPPALHPFLRRLLLQSLAARPLESPHSWQAVHGRLIEEHQGGEQATQSVRMYHSLARYGHPRTTDRGVDDLRQVLKHLRYWYDHIDKASWLEEMDFVTSAPRAAPITDSATAVKEVSTILQDAEPDDSPISRLAVEMWVAGDALRDPTHQLDNDMAAGFGRLADGLPINEEMTVLRHRANRLSRPVEERRASPR